MKEPVVLHVVGEADIGATPELAESLADALAVGRSVIVDLADCTFADVVFVNALVRAYERSRDAEVPFVVSLPPAAAPSVRLVLLQLMPQLAPFPLVPSLAAARARIGAPAPTSDLHARFGAARAKTWELLRRQDELLAEQLDLLIGARVARATLRGSTTR